MMNSASPPSSTRRDDELAVAADVAQTASRLIAEAVVGAWASVAAAGSGGPTATLTTQPRS